jgi:hypothetical protein
MPPTDRCNDCGRTLPYEGGCCSTERLADEVVGVIGDVLRALDREKRWSPLRLLARVLTDNGLDAEHDVGDCCVRIKRHGFYVESVTLEEGEYAIHVPCSNRTDVAERLRLLG